MRRRNFLIGAGAGIGVGGLLGGCAAPPEAIAPPAAGSWTWEDVRAQFAVESDLVHMSSFFLSSHPRPVRDAIERHRRGLDADPLHYVEENVAGFERAIRGAAAEYLAVQPDDLAITTSTSMGLGLVYGGLVLRPGQELLTTTHDHIVTHMALAHRAERSGAPVRKVALYADPFRATADAITAAFEEAIRPETRVAAVTWVHSGTGVKLPIRRMADALARINAGRAEHDRVLLCVDGVHGLGIDDVTAADLGCDFFIAGTHKWIFGPRGTGIVWARREAWPATRPTIPTMDPMWRPGALEAMPAAAWMTPGGFAAFEHRWAVDAAFRFHLGIGKARVAARIHELNRMAKELLARVPRVVLRTPMADELSGGIICFDVDGMAPDAVVARLREKRVVASVTPAFYDPLHVRLAPSLLTLEKDVERAVAAVRAVV